MTITNTNPASGILSDQVNVSTGIPQGFPPSQAVPAQLGSGKSDHELLRQIVAELRLQSFLLAQLLGIPDDLDTWRMATNQVNQPWNPDIFPLS